MVYEFQCLFLKDREVSEFLLLLPGLFHSVTTNGKYNFLKKNMPNIELRNIVNVSCSVYTSK